jgi:ATP-binding cassette subfamily B protein
MAELVSISAIFPFLSILTAPEIIFNHSLAKPIIKILGLTQPTQLLAPIAILFALLAIFSGGLRLLLSWAQIRFSYAMGADFSTSIYERTLYQPYSTHLMRNTSEIIAGVTAKAEGIVHQTVMPLLVIMSSIIILATVLCALFMIEPAVTVIVIACFGSIYVFIARITHQSITNNSRLISKQQVLVIKLLQEAFGGIRDVIIDQTQKLYSKIYRTADWQLRRAQSHIAVISASPKYLIEAFGMAMISALAYFLASRPEGLDTAIPLVGMLALAAQRMLPLLQQAYSSWTSMRGGQVGLWDALQLLDQPLPNYANLPSPTPLEFKHEIVLDQASFGYYKGQPRVLENLNLTITKNSRIGFIGSTGSGKTTLLDIIMGLLSPTDGSLRVDSKIINSENCRAWQAHIAHVPQSIFLTDASVTENIAFGIPYEKIDLDRVRTAAQRAQIADVIESWPSAYDTIVGERGIRLSGGQRQRIGIARALYKEADVIVLDEATSALDSETEQAVMDSLKSLGDEITLLIVAHRLTTLRDCSQVVELSAGQIKRVGTYQEIVGLGY